MSIIFFTEQIKTDSKPFFDYVCGMKGYSFLTVALICILTAGFTACGPDTPSERRVQWLMSRIPDHSSADSIDSRAFTPDFYELIVAGYRYAHDQRTMGYQDGSFMYYWYRGNDRDPEEQLSIRRILAYKKGEATARIVYKAFGQEYEHAMIMVKQHGRWVISDWDNMKSAIIYGLRF